MNTSRRGKGKRASTWGDEAEALAGLSYSNVHWQMKGTANDGAEIGAGKDLGSWLSEWSLA